MPSQHWAWKNAWVMRFWRFWEQVTEPHPALSHDLHIKSKHFLELITALSMVAISSGMIGFFQPGTLETRTVVLLGSLSGILLYFIGKTRYARYAHISTISVLLAILTLGYLLDSAQTADRFFNFLAIAVGIAAYLFSIQHAILTYILVLAWLLVLPLATQKPFFIFQATFIFNAMTGIVLLILSETRRRSLERLRENETRLSSLMEATFDALIISDMNGIILDGNSALERLTGIPLSEARGKPMLIFVSKQDRQTAARYFSQRVSQSYNLNIQHKDGHSYVAEVLTKPHLYQNSPALVTIARDVTARIEDQRQRRESQLRYEALFNHTSDAVYIIGMNGSLLGANQQGLDMLGVTLEEFLHNAVDSFVADEERQASLDMVRRVLNGETVPLYERRFKRKDASVFDAEVSVSLVRDENGAPMYVQSIVRDISERKQNAERQLQASIQAERSALLRQLVDDFAHHVRTPLANLKNSLYLMGRLDESRRPELISNMDEEINRIKLLLEDVITITRLERNTNTDSLEQIDMNQLLYRLVPDVGVRQHDWQLDLDPRKPIVLGHSQRLTDAFRRLFHNAELYTPTHKRIHITSQISDKHLRISIADEGIGIPVDDLPHIFEYFYRADNARLKYPQRNGLGLAIAKKVIEEHRGTIQVYSPNPDCADACGTCLVVELSLRRDISGFTSTPLPRPLPLNH